jgi:hypothetical protein
MRHDGQRHARRPLPVYQNLLHTSQEQIVLLVLIFAYLLVILATRLVETARPC